MTVSLLSADIDNCLLWAASFDKPVAFLAARCCEFQSYGYNLISVYLYNDKHM